MVARRGARDRAGPRTCTRRLDAVEAVKPDYSGPNVTGVVPALLGVAARSTWLPEPVAGARAVVLLVLDGLGLGGARTHPERLPELAGLAGGPITTVVPSTTPAALTSITTGLPPARHGITGFRIRSTSAACSTRSGGSWPTASRPPDPAHVQRHAVFGGRAVPVVTKASSARTGFTGVHLRGAEFHGWQTTSVLVEHVRAAGRRGRAVRVRVLPGRRRGRARVRAAHGVLPGRARRHRPTRRRAARRAAGRRRAAGHGRPRAGPRRPGRLARARNRSTRWSRPTRATAGSGTCTRATGRRGRPVRGRVGARTAGTRGCSGASSCSTRGGSGPTRCRPRTGAVGDVVLAARGPASGSSTRRCPTRRSSSPPTARSPRPRSVPLRRPPAAHGAR